MTGDEKFMLGEIKGIVETIRDSHGEQLAQLFDLGRETNGNVTANTTRLEVHQDEITNMKSVLRKAIYVGILIAVSVLGVDKLIEIVLE